MIEREDVDGVAVLRLAHGPVNAMDLELCEAIADAFGALAADPAVAVVLTGAGRSFSAGVDLRRLLDGGEEYVRRFLPALDAALRTPFELGKPVVAAVNGHAIAGGAVLAAAADRVLMTDGPGRVGIPEIVVGVPFPRVPIEVVRHAVGDQVARRLVIGAKTHAAADAVGFGLVDEIVPAGDLLDRAVAEARALATGVPPDTFAMTKAQLRREHVERMDGYADEAPGVAELWVRRVTDGWTAAYLAAATGRK
ncbi:enoyl-CoA hydratase/isomerase family protein [Pseudonocardia humida]|uniref:Enoyl-CoA hydratase/isomerase family protein n=1 Tax=Pseudonocardia humida TaxID=2800819 RepID=A0ABT1A825_9PSEU|nr:enoyl-CoA hydratase/isomerase family protein [Pseudonocardia humida]MCO1659176.1 enoyl-CoA hydratase/isomerase family protein [Pseudonocardia humida]